MKKLLFPLAIVSVLICIACLPSVSSVTQTETDGNLEKTGTVYGPYQLPYISGHIVLTENATYSSKFCIGNFCIYKNLGLTGDVGDDRMDYLYFGEKRFSSVRLQGDVSLTIGLWIGPSFGEKTGDYNRFHGRRAGVAFNGQLVTLD